jgi:hypothetical protein
VINPSLQLDPRPEAMSDVPGVCELPLTRAVVQYRDVHETDRAGGRIQDIGVALVLEGRYASAAEAVDLGSADLKTLDLSAELVVLDWAYEPTLEHTVALLREFNVSGDRGPLQRFCFRLALRVIERLGYGALTRPTLLRIGFRDVCHDLDFHEGTSVRIVLGESRVARAHLDYDGNALVFRTSTPERDSELERALRESFPSGDLRWLSSFTEGEGATYQIRFPLPLTADEARQELSLVREGLIALISRFEPERLRDVESVTDTFGARETLSHLKLRSPAAASAPASDVRRSPESQEALANVFGSAAVN